MVLERKNLEFQTFEFEVKSFNENEGKEDSKDFIFSGFASTFGNIDRGNDIIKKGAFVESLKENIPVLLFQHDQKQPIGMPLRMEETEVGLFAEWAMPKEDTLVSGRVIPQIRIGSLRKLSIGFNVEEEKFETVNGKNVRVIKRAKLWEVSIVTIPMNNDANITSFKSIVPFQDLSFLKDSDGEVDTDIHWSSNDAIGRIREFTNSKESPSSSYKNAFLWYDPEREDDFKAYKLPIADIIDERMYVIPRAVFAAAAVIKGARGGVYIPESEINGVVNNINKYYEKMGKQSPFIKNFIDTFESFNHIKDVSSFLKNFGLSKKESDMVINKIKTYKTEDDEQNEVFKILTNGLQDISAIMKKG